MDKYITGVSYRHLILTAYLTIVGKSPYQAERLAKQVGTELYRALPKDVTICPPRYRGFDKAKRLDQYEIPIIVGQYEREVRAVLARLVLRGRVDSAPQPCSSI